MVKLKHLWELYTNRRRLNGKFQTTQTPTVPAVSGVRIRTSVVCMYNLTTIACGRWSLVTS